ncbi:MAG: NAD(P)-dependent oxidoreductase [Lachnospiraceae bacterium]|nr:NAD(P)-dependent oxidoreductase [Lachnospiraceae bacterium]
MKILHIGKNGNVERFSGKNAFADSVERAEAVIGLSAEEYLQIAADADAIIVDAIGEVTGELIRNMPNLKIIHSEGVAYNKIDTDAARECGVYVCNSQGMNASAVAEQALLLMVGMLRDVAGGDRSVREGQQIEVKQGYMARGDLFELSDLTVGLIGFGDIARETAKLLKAYGVEQILYNKRTPLTAEEEDKFGVAYADMDTLLQESDLVSLHVPVNPATTGMADAAFFERMKDGSFFVNTARGELVDDGALIQALKSGKLRMAGLDTIDLEPVQKDHPLLQIPEEIGKKILFSPHIGGITTSSFKRSYAMIWEDIETALNGERPKRIVNGL